MVPVHRHGPRAILSNVLVMPMAGTLPGLLAVSLLLAPAAWAAVPLNQTPPARESDTAPSARADDLVGAWVARLRAEVEALRSEGAEPLLRTLQEMAVAEARLLDRMRTASGLDTALPDAARIWTENALRLGRELDRMPEIAASHRRRLAAVRSVLSEAAGARRAAERAADSARTELGRLQATRAAAAAGSSEAIRAEMLTAAQAATVAAREAQARLVAGFATQAAEIFRRLETASEGLDLLTTAVGAHQRVLEASADLARTRVAARDALLTLAGVADRLEGLQAAFEGLAEHWQSLDDLLRRLGDLPIEQARPGGA